MVEVYNSCFACSLIGKDCCHTPHEIIIGAIEAIKIHNKTGLKYSQFLHHIELNDKELEEGFLDLIPSGKVLVIKRNTDRSCFFLKENGCSIPNLKPTVCKVFPLWFEQQIYQSQHEIELFIEERECFLRSELLKFQSLEEGCCNFKINLKEIREIFLKLIEDFKTYLKYHYLFELMDVDSAFKEIEQHIINNTIQIQSSR